MSRSIHVFRSPDRFISGTVGEPGDRTFYVQAVHASRVGQVIVGMLVSGRCQPTSYWLNPGQHQVDLGQGRVQTVTVGARQTLELGDCR